MLVIAWTLLLCGTAHWEVLISKPLIYLKPFWTLWHGLIFYWPILSMGFQKSRALLRFQNWAWRSTAFLNIYFGLFWSRGYNLVSKTQRYFKQSCTEVIYTVYIVCFVFFTVSVKGRLDAYGKCYCIIPRVCLSVKIYWRWISLIQVIEIYLLSVSYRIPSAFLDLLILALGQMFIKVCFVILFCIFLINVK